MINIEKLDKTHAKSLAFLHAQCFDQPWGVDFFEKLLNSENSSLCNVFGWFLCDIAPNSGTFCGFILARNQITQTEILSIAIAANYRGKGLASKLLLELINSKQLTRPIFLEVAINNASAIALYQKHNFTIIGRRPNYYKDAKNQPIDAFVMSLI